MMLKQLNVSTDECRNKMNHFNQFNINSNMENQEKSFKIINQNLSDQEEYSLLRYIEERPNLISLSLIKCNLNDFQILKITQNLSCQKVLSHLSLKSNYLGENEKYFPEICQNLTNYAFLKVLDLSNNKISNSGCKSIITFFTNLDKLQELNLSSNSIDPKGFSYLKKNKNKTLLLIEFVPKFFPQNDQIDKAYISLIADIKFPQKTGKQNPYEYQNSLMKGEENKISCITNHSKNFSLDQESSEKNKENLKSRSKSHIRNVNEEFSEQIKFETEIFELKEKLKYLNLQYSKISQEKNILELKFGYVQGLLDNVKDLSFTSQSKSAKDIQTEEDILYFKIPKNNFRSDFKNVQINQINILPIDNSMEKWISTNLSDSISINNNLVKINNDLEIIEKIKFHCFENFETFNIIPSINNKFDYNLNIVQCANLPNFNFGLNDLHFKEFKQNLITKNAVINDSKTYECCDKLQVLIPSLIQILINNYENIFEKFSETESYLQKKISDLSLKIPNLIHNNKKLLYNLILNNKNKSNFKRKIPPSFNFQSFQSVSFINSQKQNDNVLMYKKKSLLNKIYEQKNTINNLISILRNKNKKIQEMKIIQEKIQNDKLKIIQKFVSLNFDSNSYNRMIQEFKENRSNIISLKNNLEQYKEQNCKLINEIENLSRKKIRHDFTFLNQNKNINKNHQEDVILSSSLAINHCSRSLTPRIIKGDLQMK